MPWPVKRFGRRAVCARCLLPFESQNPQRKYCSKRCASSAPVVSPARRSTAAFRLPVLSDCRDGWSEHLCLPDDAFRQELQRQQRFRVATGLESSSPVYRTDSGATGSKSAAARAPMRALTLREARVARIALNGGSSDAIASELSISRRTVEHHLDNVYRKLGISSRRELLSALSKIGGQ